MRIQEIITEYKADPVDGLGSVPYNSNVDYMGLRVLMRPSVFLKLARELREPRSVEYIIKHMEQGGALGQPFLTVDIPEEWRDGDFKNYAKIAGHEGRNRMMAIMKLEGDAPVEVHLFPRGGFRARHLTPEIIEQLQAGLYNETGQVTFAGVGQLLFDVM